MRDARALQILEMKNNPHRLPLLLQCSAKVQAEKNYLLLDSTHSPFGINGFQNLLFARFEVCYASCHLGRRSLLSLYSWYTTATARWRAT